MKIWGCVFWAYLFQTEVPLPGAFPSESPSFSTLFSCRLSSSQLEIGSLPSSWFHLTILSPNTAPQFPLTHIWLPTLLYYILPDGVTFLRLLFHYCCYWLLLLLASSQTKGGFYKTKFGLFLLQDGFMELLERSALTFQTENYLTLSFLSHIASTLRQSGNIGPVDILDKALH